MMELASLQEDEKGAERVLPFYHVRTHGKQPSVSQGLNYCCLSLGLPIFHNYEISISCFNHTVCGILL